MWETILATFFSYLTCSFGAMPIIVEAGHIECGEGVAGDIHVKYGIGKCFSWGPQSTRFGCCC